jgi:hypothetical protein
MPGIEIDVVSDGPDNSGTPLSQSTLQSMRSSLPNAIVARSVYHMVTEIGARLNRAPVDSRQIYRLHIYAHGVPGKAFIGCGLPRVEVIPYIDPGQILGVDDQGLMLNGSDLRRIRGLFSSDGLVQVHGCNFAAGKSGYAALHGLSAIWSVRVEASSATQWGTLAGNQMVTRLQPPILRAADLTPRAVPWESRAIPETPIASPWR